MSEVMKASNLDVGYDKNAVIRGVEINVLKGQTICLIGPNGAGKSTILRTLSGILAPVGGTVFIGQDDIHKVKPGELARRMAVVLTEKLSVNETTAYEIVSMGRVPYTGFLGRLGEEDHLIVRECMRTVGAENLAERNYVSLSDGEKQKIMIARALAQQPSLIILDEPTSHLDIKHKIEVVRILNRLSGDNGLTVILALHDVDIAVKSCQIVLMVKDGQVIAQGRPEDIIEEDTIGKLYDIDGASYNSTLGSLEICNDRPPEVYVAGGAGSGTRFYRMLSRMGYGVVTGVLHDNDIDYSVAKDMKLTVVCEESFNPISSERRQEAARYLNAVLCALDAGFPVGKCNQENIRLLRQAAKDGVTVFSLRSREEVEALYGADSGVIPVSSSMDLQKKMVGIPSGEALRRRDDHGTGTAVYSRQRGRSIPGTRSSSGVF